jgi:hypothetical protein
MSHNPEWQYKTPSPDDHKWKIYPEVSRYPLPFDFHSPEDLVIVGHLSESQYRQLKPHRTMSDDSEREKAFAARMRKQNRTSGQDGSNGSNSSGEKQRQSKSTVTACPAMGDMCANKGIRTIRHSCSICGKGMHIGGACCARFLSDKKIQVCGMCEYPSHHEEEEEEEVVLAAVLPPKPVSRDMLLESDEESSEEEEMPPLVSKVTKKPTPPVASAKKKPAAVDTAARKRSPNFGNTEDVYITQAWCSATEDSRKGSGQKQQDFNKNLFSKFVTLVDDYNEQQRPQFRIPIAQRTQKAIIDRFSKIKKVSSQFAGVVARNKIKSGETKAQHMERCCLVFEQTHKSKFIWMECFEILEECPKWNSHHEGGNGGDYNNNGKRNGSQQHVPQQRHRSTGKRNKALSDRVTRIMKSEDMETPAPSARMTEITGTLTKMTSHMVEQMNFAQWSEADKSSYFAQDAREKSLQQKMRILLLEKQLSELEAAKNAKNSNPKVSSAIAIGSPKVSSATDSGDDEDN